MKMVWYYRKNCNLLLLGFFFNFFHLFQFYLNGRTTLVFLKTLYSCGCCCRLLNPNLILQYMFHTNNEFASFYFVLEVVSVQVRLCLSKMMCVAQHPCSRCWFGVLCLVLLFFTSVLMRGSQLETGYRSSLFAYSNQTHRCSSL